MFKRITSNRDPRDTLFSELKKEFGPYYHKASSKGKSLMASYPRFWFATMIFLLLVSLGLSFTVFRNREPPAKKKVAVKQAAEPVSTGLGQILKAGAALRQTIVLKRQVDSLIAKDHLTAADSADLEKALDKLNKMHTALP